jgi:hypothetical protein
MLYSYIHVFIYLNLFFFIHFNYEVAYNIFFQSATLRSFVRILICGLKQKILFFVSCRVYVKIFQHI